MMFGGYETLASRIVDGVVVITLRNQSTGGSFLAFLFTGDRHAEFQTLSRKISDFPQRISRLIEIRPEPAGGYILTEVLPDGFGIQRWIEQLESEHLQSPQNPGMSRAAVDHLRGLEMQPSPLQPLAPGPEKPANAAAPPEEGPREEGNYTRAYRIASRLKGQRQAAAVGGDNLPRTIPAPIRPAVPPEPSAPAPAPASSPQSAIYRQVYKESSPVQRAVDTPSVPQSLPPGPVSRREPELQKPADGPVLHAPSNPAAPGLATWLGGNPAAAVKASQPGSRPAPPNPQPAYPRPEVPPIEKVLQPPPQRAYEAPRPLAPVEPYFPPAPPAQPASPLPPPVASTARSAATASIDWKTILIAAAVIIVVIGGILWLSESL